MAPAGTYDFFYLPMDTQNRNLLARFPVEAGLWSLVRTNVGYAFINFLTSPALGPFAVLVSYHTARQYQLAWLLGIQSCISITSLNGDL